MRWLVVAFAVALAPCAAWSEDPQKEKKQDEERSSNDPNLKEGAGDRGKTYGGYGNEPGDEAQSGAKQASDPDRELSKAPQDERRDGPGKSQSVRGQVVEATKNSISLKGEGGVHRLQINDKTEVMRGTNKIDVSDLKEGEEVRASFGGKGKSRVATKITAAESISRQPPSEVDKAQSSQRRMDGATPDSK
jgi:hypothetical protein